ncbi:flavin reductase (DIM6/NTAB) family NADH-FMN oxidoreductase RutF [Anaerosolibacter carboniphilus]|uniref:Flavin reductase (DIM6/NTAB) family NADH-FMN oxidoreductase RutF n=1 Tax=Anaerosolibacter carboniphilus TaxID=1417629 RepID=A0A841KWH4_9FIRM|nr:flavin reductase family protein [Anaerosolibacter carboniphilus]MBB6217707.1 flavin reductase (DIM6/NTAB) family NADH-FMN oxidoreductase RutF [Anaerosolibacter carboniphilus]
MAKITWKPGTMVYPVPAVLVTCGDAEENYNIITVAWTGTVCSDPAMTYISIRPERHSYEAINRTKEFVINLATEDLVKATDFCGVKSGRDINKFKEMRLTPEKASKVSAPLIKESPINIECKVTKVLELGTHHMFLAKVVAVNVDDQYMDDKNKFHLDWANPICYSHGQYYGLKKSLGGFGFSVAKKKKRKR